MMNWFLDATGSPPFFLYLRQNRITGQKSIINKWQTNALSTYNGIMTSDKDRNVQTE